MLRFAPSGETRGNAEMWRTISVLGSLVAPVVFAWAADLNSPVERKITIKSEISRGSWAALDCQLQAIPTSGSGLIDCISRINKEERQKNTITDPFQLGIYEKAYRSLEGDRRVLINFHKPDPRNDKIFAMHEKFYYNQQHRLKESLGISDDDVCRANADAEHEATAKCEPLVPPP